MNIRDYWLKYSPAIRTQRNNKSLVVPAFSNVGCGPARRSLKSLQVQNFFSTVNLGVYTLDSLDLSTAFTIECLIKPQGNYDTSQQYLYSMVTATPGAEESIQLYLENQRLNLLVYKGGVAQTILTSNSIITNHAWQHVAATYDGTNLRLYVNGKLDATSGAINSPIDGTQSVFNLITINGLINKPFFGYFAEFRIWTVARTVDQINYAMLSHREIAGVLDTGLIRYYKCNDAAAAIVNSIDGHSVSLPTSAGTTLTGEDYPPLRYGASFIANRFTVTTSGPCSLIYPVAAPDDADHCLCVSWLDEDGQTTIRRRLYGASEDVGTEDIAPIPADYMGEVLPATFYLEFWNVDGQQYINLPVNLTIYTSHTSQPSHSIDHSSASDATPSGTTALATAFPSTFPLTFNSAQTYP